MVKKGKFIVLEGIDGSGSTTQLKLLKQWFEAEGAKYGQAWFTWEPTDGPIGNVIRLSLKKRLQSFDEKTMALLFAADRSDHIYRSDIGGQENGMLAKLNQGIHVITDRYVLSSLAYQARELGLDWVYTANIHALVPDITIYIDLNAEIASKRMILGRSHQDQYEDLPEQLEIEKQYNLAIEYLRNKGQNLVEINGEQTTEEVHQNIVCQVKTLFNQ